MTKFQTTQKIQELLREFDEAGYPLNPDEIRVRFLYRHGLLPYLTIKQPAILSNHHEKTIWRQREKWGFRKVHGAWRTNLTTFTAVMSGRELSSQGDARNTKRPGRSRPQEAIRT